MENDLVPFTDILCELEVHEEANFNIIALLKKAIIYVKERDRYVVKSSYGYKIVPLQWFDSFYIKMYTNGRVYRNSMSNIIIGNEMIFIKELNIDE